MFLLFSLALPPAEFISMSTWPLLRFRYHLENIMDGFFILNIQLYRNRL